MKLTLKYYADPGHGWLAVKTKLLEDLGVAGAITHYSYKKGATSYLEEDCDMATFLDAARGNLIEVEIISKHTNKSSPIRSYPHY